MGWRHGKQERKGWRRLPRGMEYQGWSGEEEVVDGKLGEQWDNGESAEAEMEEWAVGGGQVAEMEGEAGGED